jgi:hypothetical protein
MDVNVLESESSEEEDDSKEDDTEELSESLV